MQTQHETYVCRCGNTITKGDSNDTKVELNGFIVNCCVKCAVELLKQKGRYNQNLINDSKKNDFQFLYGKELIVNI